MQYAAVTFIEGLISFISPCMLPMLPLYISYFAAGDDTPRRGVLLRAVAFVLGFTVVFSTLGLFAGSIGHFLSEYRKVVDIVCGAVVIFFGLGYLELIKLPFFKGMKEGRKITGFFSAFVFGAVYSVSLTPCVGAFLGSALAMAASSSSALRGALLLVVYSVGLGVPFVISAVLIDKLRGALGFIKRHYKVINVVCGVFLIALGALMATGVFSSFAALFS
ncbi:MAG: cytochrome c biogenesis protein CcdA [Clostridia bacterium]|nr:cytochrome c biogenesis protein CcdA [Clostridia bacterium]